MRRPVAAWYSSLRWLKPVRPRCPEVRAKDRRVADGLVVRRAWRGLAAEKWRVLVAAAPAGGIGGFPRALCWFGQDGVLRAASGRSSLRGVASGGALLAVLAWAFSMERQVRLSQGRPLEWATAVAGGLGPGRRCWLAAVPRAGWEWSVVVVSLPGVWSLVLGFAATSASAVVAAVRGFLESAVNSLRRGCQVTPG